ncbi:hypothetical protein DEU56DRAFT_759712 [Suillus clintonianus]|uniref:uncharacterized protein n=1 Tax=Suillus clintonianus TaxID=1904413 RepID=UPI001B880AA7|nr:uncharacterized protein DEU56DRAFT_759712 [Suillus clintonianus]KAG2124352.1 hypothetical protein DEU56DRAFT_759712 [Suillus clintonianus]
MKLAASMAVKEIEDMEVITMKLLCDATNAVKALSLALEWFPKEQEKVENKDIESLTLLWHQCVGVMAIINKIWSAIKKEGEVPGMLVADEVQEVTAGRERPNGVMSNINLTNVCPAPILENEFGDFFNSPLATLATPLIHHIILVNHSMSFLTSLQLQVLTLFKLMGTSRKVFDPRKGVTSHNSNKASDDTHSLKKHNQTVKYLWAGQKFLTVSIDKVHEMWNLTASFYVTLEASVVKPLASGTPLYTGPMLGSIFAWRPATGSQRSSVATVGKINNTLIPYEMVIIFVQLDDTELNINMSIMAQITGLSMAAALDDSASFNMIYCRLHEGATHLQQSQGVGTWSAEKEEQEA